MKIAYSSNKSGGVWWLKDEDWKNLEDAGWEVRWGNSYFCGSKDNWGEKRPKYLKKLCKDASKCQGHRCFRSYETAMASGKRFLGSIAQHATVEKPTMEEAIEEWERITGQNAEDEGCNCCGQPHNFSEVTE